VFVFLSYAEEDREIAAEISAWLGAQGVDRFDWLTSGSGRFLPLIEGAISRADAFLALMSPHFLASKWCGRERDMALFREQELQEDDPERAFVHVLEVGATRPDRTGFLSGYNWVHFTPPATRSESFDEMARRLSLGRRAAASASAALAPALAPAPAGAAVTPAGRRGGTRERPASAGPRADGALTLPTFRNRDREFEDIWAGLVTAGDKPFWLVTAPPQVGKTWLLKQIRTSLEEPAPGAEPSPPWTVSMVDVRNLPGSMRQDPGALIAKFFGLPDPVPGTQEALLAVARTILQRRQPWVCLLDHAELLEKPVAADFRARMSQIHQEVQNGRRRNVRLGLIVASRRPSEWRGVTPSPRFRHLPLSEFETEVVLGALVQLAEEMDLDYSEARRDSELVYELTQGLPALLTACLEWIKEDETFNLAPLRSTEKFRELASPYINGELLARESLLPVLVDRNGNPVTEEQAAGALVAVREAYRVLAPFRLFTRSHLHHYLESDRDFRAALTAPGWDAEDLWIAVSDTALLDRLRELWKVVQPAVRRLLYRYYYSSDEECATVHSEARKIVEVWASQQTGKEQVAFLVECLWHEAMALRKGPPGELEQRLVASARTLSRHFRGSPAYAEDDLRRYAAEQMADDAELQHAVSLVPGLHHRLIEIVRNPPLESPRTPPKEPA
jgi:hypothetical protein